MNNNDLLTTVEFAKLLGVARCQGWRIVSASRFGRRIGNRLFIGRRAAEMIAKERRNIERSAKKIKQ